MSNHHRRKSSILETVSELIFPTEMKDEEKKDEQKKDEEMDLNALVNRIRELEQRNQTQNQQTQETVQNVSGLSTKSKIMISSIIGICLLVRELLSLIL